MKIDVFADVEELDKVIALLFSVYPSSNIKIHYVEPNEQPKQG